LAGVLVLLGVVIVLVMGCEKELLQAAHWVREQTEKIRYMIEYVSEHPPKWLEHIREHPPRLPKL
jgi:hypothetical protein